MNRHKLNRHKSDIFNRQTLRRCIALLLVVSPAMSTTVAMAEMQKKTPNLTTRIAESKAPSVDGLEISWPDDGWYQVQDAVSYVSICEGGLKCQVDPGTYIVINHSTGKRWEDIVVEQAGNGPTSGGPTIPNPDSSGDMAYRMDFNFPEYSGVAEQGTMNLQILHSQLILIGNDYTMEHRNQIKPECQSIIDNNPINESSYNYTLYFNYEDCIYTRFVDRHTEYLSLDNTEFFAISSASDSNYSAVRNPAKVTRYVMPRGSIVDLNVLSGLVSEVNWPFGTQNSLLGHYSYLTLPEPMTSGHSYTITQGGGRQVSFVYDENETISRAIKINQSGYPSRTSSKFAYLGGFQPGFGAVDFERWNGTAFEILHADTAAVAFSGNISARSEASADNTGTCDAGYLDEKVGEQVYELDFSAFNEPGEYYIRVSGVGRSWPFKIGNDAVGRSFYTHLRGLLHQRRGADITAQFSGWPRQSHHEDAYLADYFEPFGLFNSYYGGDLSSPINGSTDYDDIAFHSIRCFMAEQTGQTCSLQYPASDPPDPSEYPQEQPFGDRSGRGGWYDAADFDGTWDHYETFFDLTWAYEIAPRNFVDGQEHSPESNNGIPDILDEAAWGLQLWRNSQRSDGAVSARLETWSYIAPGVRPEDDPLRYYFSAPAREYSLRYASAAAQLSRLMRRFNASEADGWLNSAKLAYNYGNDPANHATRYNYFSAGFDVREPDGPVDLATSMAGLELYLATDGIDNDLVRANYLNSGAQAYRRAEFEQPRVHTWPYSVLRQTYGWAFHKNSAIPEDIRDHARLFYTQQADEVVSRINTAGCSNATPGYRSLVKPGNVAWGAGTGMFEARKLILAYGLTQSTEYLELAAQAVDWVQGANPLGMSYTTGVGYHYPAVLQHAESATDDIVDPVPGITIYGVTGNIKWTQAVGSYNIGRDVHGTQNQNLEVFDSYEDRVINRVLQPDYIPTRADAAGGDPGNFFHRHQPALPFWRRYAPDSRADPSVHEFTIHETISPMVFVLGVLLEPGWKPDSSLKSDGPRVEERVFGLWPTP